MIRPGSRCRFPLDRAEPLVHLGIALPVRAGLPRFAVYGEPPVEGGPRASHEGSDAYAQLRAVAVAYLLENVERRPDGAVVLPPVLRMYLALCEP